jgi:hypothetical protein
MPQQRGIVGWVFRVAFFAFNIGMAGFIAQFVYGMYLAANMDGVPPGIGVTTGIGVGLIVVLWAAGALILGLLAHFTSKATR